MSSTRGTVPVSADPVSIRMKSKTGKNSEENQNETDKNAPESRVYIGAASSRWRELRERSRFPTDADLALFLLDWYENQAVTSTQSRIVRPRRLHPPSAEPVNDQAIITSEAVIKYLSRKTPPPSDPPPSQVCENTKTETPDGETPEVSEVCVKKEETLELDIHKYEHDLNDTPEDICVKEEDPDHKDYLYCEVCKSFVFNKCEVHGPPLFIPDTPVPMGVCDRARLTLPPGLEIQKSSIPDAGLGVFNKGETVPVGAHFGPYQGELVDREEAKNSGYSWVVYEDVKTEPSDGETPEVSEVCVKKEETLELDIHKYEHELNDTPEDICIKEEDPDHKDYLYCEVCKSVVFNKCEVHGPPLFIPDTPVPVGVSDRARLTLPPGLEIQKSSIPDAGLGVFNKGETVPVGAHFGPYQGETVDREEAKNSGYSWVIYRRRQCEEYIDATRETESNWMRYVNCARNDEEQNLVAFQYRGGILYRCCRPINPGQELLVWYEEEYAKALSPAFDYLWNKKCSTNELNTSLLHNCSSCVLSYTSQIYLHKHIQRCHYEEYMRLRESGEIKNDLQISSTGCSSLQILPDTLGSDTSHSNMQKEIQRCLECGESFIHEIAFATHQCIRGIEKPHRFSECGDRFTHQRYLHRHQWIHKGEKPYRCSECGKCFTSQLHLQLHQRIHTGERPFQCSQCGRSFTQKRILIKHQRIHTGEKPFQCSQCGEMFALKSHLQKHQRSHVGENVHQCMYCEKSFTYQSDLQQHQRVHTGEKPYQCSQCGKSFFQRGYLNYHVRLHAGDKPHQCAQCGKSFTYQSALKVHQRIHAGDKPYQCLQCGKSFTVLSGLQVHQRIHTGERPYLCAQCGKSFYHSSALKVHQRTHIGEKPYPCSQCGKSFTEKRTLEKHQQRLHAGEKPYPCSQCEETFSSLSGLRTHHRSHTDATPYRCSRCGNGFTEKRALQKHQLLHTREKPYHCSECEKRFSSLSSFQTHQRLHTEGKPYPCSQCEKSFHHSRALKVHQCVHTGEKPHQCSHCGKGFTEKRALQNHQRLHTGEKPYPCSDCEMRFTSQASLINHQQLHTEGKPYHCSKCGKGFAQNKTFLRHKRGHGRKKPKPRS